MDYRILRDGEEVGKVHDWPEKLHPDGDFNLGFARAFVGWVSKFQPFDYHRFFWEAVPVETESGE